MGIVENRLGLIELGNKVMSYEGNMGDEHEFEQALNTNRMGIFLVSLVLEKPKDLKKNLKLTKQLQN